MVDRGYHDVTVVDMDDERKPMVVMKDMTRLRVVILRKGDSGRYVPSCGQISPRFSTAVEVSDSLVHHVDGLTSGLFGTPQEWS